MSEHDLRKVQLLQLSILKIIHKICDDYGIQYFLSDGSLLGAVRHKGFIPWDDDIDIGMFRDQYVKFCQICKTELPNCLFLQNIETDNDYCLPFSKILLKDTQWVEKATENSLAKTGVNIDVFPYDKIPRNIFLQKFHEYYALYLLKICYIKYKYKISSKNVLKRAALTLLAKIISIFYRKIEAAKRLDFHIQRYNTTDSGFFTKFGGDYKRNIQIESVYRKLILQDFEDGKFYIPIDYHIILKKLYGDYNNLPSKENRIAHDVIKYDFGEYE